MSRLRNTVLAGILRPRAIECQFRGEAGMADLARKLSRRARIQPPLSAAIVKAYLGGSRTPPHATLVHLCAILGCTPEITDVALSAADAHVRAVRARRGKAAPKVPKPPAPDPAPPAQ